MRIMQISKITLRHRRKSISKGIYAVLLGRGQTVRYLICVSFLFSFVTTVATAQTSLYVGDSACSECHMSLCESFIAMSPKKSQPSEGFPKLLPDLSEEQRMFCYSCHVTGTGAPGGFVSYEKTPQMGHVGCETCHGPGNNHVESGDPADIIRHPGMDGCTACHNGKRVPLPKVYGRPHGLNE